MYVVVLNTKTVTRIGADSMGAMGAIAPTAKKLWGDAPKSPHKNFDRLISKVHSFNCYIGYDRVLTACPE